MTDITERLRDLSLPILKRLRLCAEAADEIDRLRVKVETGLQRRKESTERIRVLEEALREIADKTVIGWILRIARRALEQTDD